MTKAAMLRADVKRYEVFPVGKSPVRLTLSVQTADGNCDLQLNEETALGIAADILGAVRVAKGKPE